MSDRVPDSHSLSLSRHFKQPWGAAGKSLDLTAHLRHLFFLHSGKTCLSFSEVTEPTPQEAARPPARAWGYDPICCSFASVLSLFTLFFRAQ